MQFDDIGIHSLFVCDINFKYEMSSCLAFNDMTLNLLCLFLESLSLFPSNIICNIHIATYHFQARFFLLWLHHMTYEKKVDNNDRETANGYWIKCFNVFSFFLLFLHISTLIIQSILNYRLARRKNRQQNVFTDRRKIIRWNKGFPLWRIIIIPVHSYYPFLLILYERRICWLLIYQISFLSKLVWRINMVCICILCDVIIIQRKLMDDLKFLKFLKPHCFHYF